MGKFVYDFAEGNKDQKDLLGGKGANLAEMTNLGLPVPPGFTITTEACRAYLRDGAEPAGAGRARSTSTSTRSRPTMGRRLGDPDDPLLVSVRSGREVLDARDDGDRPQRRAQRRSRCTGLARAARRRAVRLGLLPPADPDVRQDRARHRRRARSSDALDEAKTAQGHRGRPRPRRRRPAGARRRRSRRSSPSTPAASSRRTRASSWTWRSTPSSTRGTPTRAIALPPPGAHPRTTSAPPSTSARWSSATSAPDSGTGVAFTRDPATGAQGVYGDYLQNAQGEDVVAGIRNTLPLADLERARQGRPTTSCCDDHGPARAALPRPVRHRVHHRARQAVDAADPGRQAHRRGRVPHRHPARRRGPDRHGRGAAPGHRRPAGPADVPALRPGRRRRSRSPRACTPRRAPPSARRCSTPRPPSSGPRAGEQVILVRRETNPDDLSGMIAAAGHPDQPRRQDLARRRRRPRHGQDLRVRRRGAARSTPSAGGSPRPAARRRRRGRRHLHRRLHRRGVPRRGAGRAVAGGAATSRASSTREPTTPTTWSTRCTGSSTHADEHAAAAGADQRRHRRGRRPRPAVRRPGHRPVPHRAHVPRRPPRAGRAADPGRRRRGAASAALDALLPLQREDFVEIFEAMDGLPVTVRLLDPPLHEFLPDLTELSVQVAVAEERGEDADEDERAAGRGRAACTSRTRCSGCAASGWAWSSRACSRCRCGRSPRPRPRSREGRRRPAAGDHGPAGRRRAGAGDDPRRRPTRCSPRSPTRAACDAGRPDRHDDRAAAGRADRRRRSPRRPSSSPSAPTTSPR